MKEITVKTGMEVETVVGVHEGVEKSTHFRRARWQV